MYIGIFIKLPINDKKKIRRADCGERPNLLKAILKNSICKRKKKRGKSNMNINIIDNGKNII